MARRLEVTSYRDGIIPRKGQTPLSANLTANQKSVDDWVEDTVSDMLSAAEPVLAPRRVVDVGIDD